MAVGDYPRRLIAGVAIALATALTAIPAAATDIVGIWWTPERDGKIEIVRDSSGAVSGRIIAVLPDDADNLDDQNPDATLRGRRVPGLTILRDFKPDADGTWTGGTIYDPESGRTYRGTLRLDDGGRLMMRGFVWIGIFGRTETLTRVDGPRPETNQLGEPDLVYPAR